MPGGTCHVGEGGHAAAVRETEEEIGDLPLSMTVRAILNHVDPDGKQVYLYLCEAAMFEPKLNGATPEETKGVAWFRRKEVGSLSLVDKFRDDWDHIIADCLDGIKKSLQRTVNETGEVSILTDASQPLQAVGSRWPYPHRADGAEQPEGAPGDVPGGTAGEMGAAEPPNRINDFAEPEPHGLSRHAVAMTERCPRGGGSRTLPRPGSLTRATRMTRRGPRRKPRSRRG